MPSDSKLFVEPFLGGLNTETSSVEDAILYTSDELNCTILPEGMRGRRLGFNIERDGKWIETENKIQSKSVYYWNNVYTNVSYVVVQTDQTLNIYPDQDPISQQEPVFTYEIPVLNYTDIKQPLSITGVSNGLFVVGKWCFPFVIKYDVDLQKFYVLENNLKYRDFNGVDDGYLVDELPSVMTKQHLYNLKNQGWDKYILDPETKKEKPLLPVGDYEGLFYEQYNETYGYGRYPANNLQWFAGKEKSGDYNTADLMNRYLGNTPAPKGHYILDYKNRSRNKVSGIEVDKIEVPEGEISFTYKDNVGDKEEVCVLMSYAQIVSDVNEFKRVWGDFLERLPKNYKEVCTLPGNISGNLQKLKVTLNDIFLKPTSYGDNNNYWYINALYQNRQDDSRKDVYLYAMPFKLKVFGRTSQGDSIELYSLATQLDEAPAGTPKTYDIDMSSNTENYISYYITLDFSDIPENTEVFKCCQLEYNITIQKLNSVEEGPGIFEGLPVSDMLKGAVNKVESFGGRLFYLCNDVVLFSQTLNADLKNYDKCYQEADPTSEEISDVVATDGGVINMLTLGKGLNMKRFNRGIIVFGENEISGIISPLNNLFTANEYDIVKISNAGLMGEYSVVSTNDKIYYWSVHGIFEIGIDENNAIYSKCISNSTIQRFYMELSETAKQNCIGYYDYANNCVYWFYPTNTTQTNKLDGCLVLDLTYNSFMPLNIDAGNHVTDVNGLLVGVLQNLNTSLKLRDNSVIDCKKIDNTVYNKDGEVIGYCSNKYITDCTSSIRVKQTKPVLFVTVDGNKVNTGEDAIVLPIKEDSRYSPKTSGIIMVSDDNGYSFGSFNDGSFKDWNTTPYDSYMVSRPIMFEGFSRYGKPLQDTAYDKQVPILQTLFKRTEQSPLTSAPAPVEHVYKLKDDVSYISADPEYDITSGTLSKHSIAKAFIFNDKGLFKSCKIRVDVKDFKGKVIDLGAELICDKVSKKTINVYNKTVTNDYIDLEFNEALDTPHLNYAVRVVAEIRGGEIYKEKIHFTADFVQDRTSPLLPVFSGFKKIEVENTEKLYSVGDFDVQYRLNARIPSMYMTAFQIEAMPPKALEDKNWAVTWECRTDGNSNLFDVSRSYVSYGTSSKEYPTETAFDSSIQYVNNLSKLLKIGLKSYNYNRTDWKGTKVRYKIVGLVPEYKEAGPVKSKANYIAASGANLRMRWGWALNDRSNRWDMVQNGYRPQKDFLYDEYVESRVHVRGRGKAFQVEIRNDGNKDFRLAGMNLVVRSK